MKRLIIVWAVLVALTIMSMISGQAGSDVKHLSIPALAFLFGFSVLKAEGILRHFLDLRASSAAWRGSFTALLVGLAVILFAVTAYKL